MLENLKAKYFAHKNNDIKTKNVMKTPKRKSIEKQN
jgi:hypothetical protein